MKDAPRMWRLRLHELLTIFGCKALQSDQSIYCKWISQIQLILTLSTHVDDLKGGGIKSEVEKLFAHLEAAVGKGKLQYGAFEHCGVIHKQSEDRSTITTCMDHYVQTLNAINVMYCHVV